MAVEETRRESKEGINTRLATWPSFVAGWQRRHVHSDERTEFTGKDNLGLGAAHPGLQELTGVSEAHFEKDL